MRGYLILLIRQFVDCLNQENIFLLRLTFLLPLLNRLTWCNKDITLDLLCLGIRRHGGVLRLHVDHDSCRCWLEFPYDNLRSLLVLKSIRLICCLEILLPQDGGH